MENLYPIQIVEKPFTPFVLRERFLSPNECSRLVKYSNSSAYTRILVSGYGSAMDVDRRYYSFGNWHWLTKRLVQAFQSVNRTFNFHIAGLASMDFSITRLGGHRFVDWSSNIGENCNSKISLTVPLTVAESFELHSSELPKLEVGTGVFFPSFLLYRFKPVEAESYYLTVEVYGEAWK